MDPEQYDYENQHAIRDDEHDYEEEEDYPDQAYQAGDYYGYEGDYEREDLGWDGGYED